VGLNQYRKYSLFIYCRYTEQAPLISDIVGSILARTHDAYDCGCGRFAVSVRLTCGYRAVNVRLSGGFSAV
jgi:hypothetical protein